MRLVFAMLLRSSLYGWSIPTAARLVLQDTSVDSRPSDGPWSLAHTVERLATDLPRVIHCPGDLLTQPICGFSEDIVECVVEAKLDYVQVDTNE